MIPALAIAGVVAEAATDFRYVPFFHPLPAWDVWYLMALPLCAGVAIVYKSIRCRSMNHLPREAAKATVWILAGLAGAALGLALIVRLMEWAGS